MKIKMLFTSLGQSIMERTVPSVLRTTKAVSRPLAQFFPIPTSQLVNNIIFIIYTIKNDQVVLVCGLAMSLCHCVVFLQKVPNPYGASSSIDSFVAILYHVTQHSPCESDA